LIVIAAASTQTPEIAIPIIRAIQWRRSANERTPEVSPTDGFLWRSRALKTLVRKKARAFEGT
jgi:hypothetical protein